MGTMTPAQRRALYESARFARETTYNGPLGPEYTPAGTRLQLWAPTAEQAAVNLYRKGHDSPCIGTLPLQRGPQAYGASGCPATSMGITIPLRSRWTASHGRPATPTPALAA